MSKEVKVKTNVMSLLKCPFCGCEKVARITQFENNVNGDSKLFEILFNTTLFGLGRPIAKRKSSGLDGFTGDHDSGTI